MCLLLRDPRRQIADRAFRFLEDAELSGAFLADRHRVHMPIRHQEVRVGHGPQCAMR